MESTKNLYCHHLTYNYNLHIVFFLSLTNIDVIRQTLCVKRPLCFDCTLGRQPGNSINFQLAVRRTNATLFPDDSRPNSALAVAPDIRAPSTSFPKDGALFGLIRLGANYSVCLARWWVLVFYFLREKNVANRFSGFRAVLGQRIKRGTEYVGY